MNVIKKGRYGEYYIILQLIEKGFEVYPSLVDDRGVDAVIRNCKGHYLEIQIKSVWSIKYPDWFQIRTKEKEPQCGDNFFIICLDAKKECWIFPSTIFFNRKYANRALYKGCYTWDLNLSTKRRGNRRRNKELLIAYKDNWELLLEH